MGQCLAKLPHSCGSKSGLQVFARDEDDTVDGYCFACNTYVRNPYDEERKASSLPAPRVRTEAEVRAELAEIDGYPTVALDKRKLSASGLEEFGIKIGLSEEDGKTPELAYFPYTKDGRTVGYKVKLLSNGRVWSVGDLKGVDFFGWEQAKANGGKKLIITEGEFDAVAMARIIDRYTKDEYKDFKPAVISLPHGAGSAANDLAKFKAKIKQHFKEIILCFDMDEAGRKAVDEVMKIMPEAKSAALPKKDANDCIIQGVTKAAFQAITFNASTPKNTRLIFGEELHEAAREVAQYGELTWPWDHLNETTRGIRYGETIYIGAGVKMGKSEFLNHIAAHFIKVHGVKVFMAKPEESNKKTYKLIAGKLMGSVFHDPKKEFDFDAYDEAGKILDGKLAMVNLYQHLGWETLKADIISAAQWGARAIFIDPITNLTNGENAGEANSKLQEIAQELAAMALDHNIVIFIFCHLKAPEGNISKEKRDAAYKNGKYIGLGNCPHEQGGDIYSNQFAGSRAMMRSCNMMLGLEGNKDDELPKEERNMRHIVLLEDREFGETGRFPIYWNSDTTLFKAA